MIAPCPCCKATLNFDEAHAGQVVACPYCGQQINVNIPVQPISQPKRQVKKRASNLDRVILGGCIVGAVLLLAWVVYLVIDANGDTPIAVKARIEARKAVLERVKYPRDAELGLLSDFTKNFESECVVHGTVKVVNGIGAKHTLDYWVGFKIKNGDDLTVTYVRFNPDQ